MATLFQSLSLSNLLALLSVLLLVIAGLTWAQIQVLPRLHEVVQTRSLLLLDRHGQTLAGSVNGNWNIDMVVGLPKIPKLMLDGFVQSEDQRFFEHSGVDWLARLAALKQNMLARRCLRGASTITEQVVRLLHKRERGLWAKWLEGFEAQSLERQESKFTILEFYLNQLPYAAQQRGIGQAARHYFDRDLDTLNAREMLALIVLVRAPGAYDLRHDSHAIDAPVNRLAAQLIRAGKLDVSVWQAQADTPLQLQSPSSPVPAYHFSRYVRTQFPNRNGVMTTTLDASLQQSVQQLLDQRVKHLAGHGVHNAAALIVDHETAEVLAWVVAGSTNPALPGAFIDAVATPRQPGSTLKPFVYAAALQQGWTAATLIKDEPLQASVGHGLHDFRNFSREFYGDITLREALANSLNIPAVKALQYVGVDVVLPQLRALGLSELKQSAQMYGDGLVLGNGEVSLLHLVQAYTALAHQGMVRKLRVQRDEADDDVQVVFSPEVSSIVADMLSDNDARKLEFGAGNALSFPQQTAVKTGTSNDHRDAWMLAFNHHYVVGVWMGNLDRQPMKELTGSTGPALVVRSILNELNRDDNSRPLYLSPRLVKKRICVRRMNEGVCQQRDEWFVRGTEPVNESTILVATQNKTVRIAKPGNETDMAMDPRIPDTAESYAFELEGVNDFAVTRWVLNGQLLAQTNMPRYLWSMKKGQYRLSAEWMDPHQHWQKVGTVSFTVK